MTPGKSAHAARKVRNERLLLSAAASGVAVLLAAGAAAAGYFPVAPAIYYSVAVCALVGAFYFVFLTGLNKGFKDRSLTMVQLMAAGLVTGYPLYHGMNVRGGVLAIFLIAFMFGILTLDLRRLAILAFVYVLCYACVIVLWMTYKPDVLDLNRELFGLCGFAVLLGWFTALGAYISRLKRNLGDTGAALARALQDAESLARVDVLTGCYNRRYAMELLDTEAQRTARGHKLTLCLADIDHFKSINDRFGHQAGDEVLKEFAIAVKECLRSTDILARYGGEEFLITFSDSSLGDAIRIAERIRHSVAQLAVAGLPGGERVTLSLGLAEHAHPEPLDATLARADQALYRAKTGGRNRVVQELRAELPAAPPGDTA